MSIASELTRLQNAKAAIKQSLENKGATIDSSATLSDYPSIIDNLPSGGDTLTFVVDNTNLTYDISTGESTQTSYHISYNGTDVTNDSAIYSINQCIDYDPIAGTLTPFDNSLGTGGILNTLFAVYNGLAAYVEINVEYYESVQPVQVTLTGYEPSYTIPYDTQNYFYMLPNIEITATLDNGEEPTNPKWSISPSDLESNLDPDGTSCEFSGMLMNETAGTRQITVTFTCDQGTATEGFELVVLEMPSLQITATKRVNSNTGEYTITATSNYANCNWTCSGLSNITETGKSYSSTYTVSGKFTQGGNYTATINCTNEIGTQATTTVNIFWEGIDPITGINDNSVLFNWDFAKSAYVYSGQGFTNAQLSVHDYYLIPKSYIEGSSDTTTLKSGERIELVEADDDTDVGGGITLGFLNEKGSFLGFDVPSDLGTAYIKQVGNQWFVYGYEPIIDDYEVIYNTYLGTENEDKCLINKVEHSTFVTDSDNQTVRLFGEQADISSVSSMSIDGQNVTVAKTYNCPTAGTHTFEFELTNNVPQYLFYQTGLKTLVIPEGVTSLGQDAISGNSKLKYIKLPSSLTTGYISTDGARNYTISSNPILMFVDVSPSFSNLSISKTIFGYNGDNISKGTGLLIEGRLVNKIAPNQSVNNYVYSQLNQLKTVDLSNCTSVGIGSFNGCKNLNNLTIGASTTLDNNSFVNSPIGGTLTLDSSSSYTSSGKSIISNGTLILCRDNTTSDTVTTIRTNSWEYYGSERVVVPSSVTNIATYGIVSKADNSVIEFTSTTPATIATNAIRNFTKILVPCSAVSAYKTAWSDYADIIECDGGKPKHTVKLIKGGCYANSGESIFTYDLDGTGINYTLTGFQVTNDLYYIWVNDADDEYSLLSLVDLGFEVDPPIKAGDTVTLIDMPGEVDGTDVDTWNLRGIYFGFKIDSGVTTLKVTIDTTNNTYTLKAL